MRHSQDPSHIPPTRDNLITQVLLALVCGGLGYYKATLPEVPQQRGQDRQPLALRRTPPPRSPSTPALDSWHIGGSRGSALGNMGQQPAMQPPGTNSTRQTDQR